MLGIDVGLSDGHSSVKLIIPNHFQDSYFCARLYKKDYDPKEGVPQGGGRQGIP